MQALSGSNEGELCDLAKPLISTSARVSALHSISHHQHHRGQILFSLTGSMTVSVGDKPWFLYAGQAIWIPPAYEHCVPSGQNLNYRNVFIEPTACSNLPAQAGPVTLSALAYELINESASFGKNYRRNSAESRLNAVLLDQLNTIKTNELKLPLPTDKRALKVCHHFLTTPSCDKSLEDVARMAGASSRTIARHFLNQTGLSFSHWRQRLRILHSIKLVESGMSITEAALASGYGSTSAFSTVFKRLIGRSPLNYFRK